MKSYRKISSVFLNFNSKIIREKNFGKTCKNQSIEKRNDTGEHNGKTKNVSFVERERTCEYRITSAVTDKAFDFYAINDLEGQFHAAVRLVRGLYMAFYQHFIGM